jgi:predicted acetyltransferase
VNQRVRTDVLAAFRGAGDIVDEPELDEVAALREAVLSAWDGPLDRPPGWVDQQVEPHRVDSGDRHRRIGWREDGRLTGYLRYESTHGDAAHWVVVRVHEFVAGTVDSLRGLLGFLGGFEAQASEITFAHTVMRLDAPLLQMIPDADKRIGIDGRICWMQRIVDLPRAMESRGWRGADCSVALEISDPARGEPIRGVLEVRNGAASFSPGGDGAVRLGIGVLSAWYAGTLRASDAALYGLMEGRAGDLASMDAAIGESRPWMPDFF